MCSSGIARHAAEVATDGEVAHLEEALAANRAALGDVTAFESTDVAFHLAVAEIGGNAVFTAMHRAIVGWLALQRRVSLRAGEALMSALRHHENVFSAIARRKPDDAWRAMDAHIREVEAYYAANRGDASDEA